MLNIGILLNHSDLVFVHESLYVGALFDEASPEVGALLGPKIDQDVNHHVEEDIRVLDLTCCAHQAH